MSYWGNPANITTLKRLWNEDGLSAAAIAAKMGITRNAVIGKSYRLNLQFRGGRSLVLKPTHDAIMDGHTLFPGKVSEPDNHVLKTGGFQRKLGPRILKGHWKGMPVFSLTLEERATCPRDCKLWRSCYGNNMHNAKRHQHGPELEAALYRGLSEKQRLHPAGFVVRLHILGDFYSVRYVDFWRQALTEFPALRVFGYTAWQLDTPIGAAIASLRDARWRRFAVRTSGASEGPRTLVVKDEALRGDAIVCPAQTGRTNSCSTCGLCWASKKPVAFLAHGDTRDSVKR